VCVCVWQPERTGPACATSGHNSIIIYWAYTCRNYFAEELLPLLLIIITGGNPLPSPRGRRRGGGYRYYNIMLLYCISFFFFFNPARNYRISRLRWPRPDYIKINLTFYVSKSYDGTCNIVTRHRGRVIAMLYSGVAQTVAGDEASPIFYSFVSYCRYGSLSS